MECYQNQCVEASTPPPCPADYNASNLSQFYNENNLISLNQEQEFLYDNQRNDRYEVSLPPPCPFGDIETETGAHLGGLFNDSFPQKNSIPIIIEFIENENYDSRNMPEECLTNMLPPQEQVYGENNLMSLSPERQLPNVSHGQDRFTASLISPLEAQVCNENNLISLNQEQQAPYDSQRNYKYDTSLPPPCPFGDIEMETGTRLGGLMNDSIPSRNNTPLPITIEFVESEQYDSGNIPEECLMDMMPNQEHVYDENNLISLSPRQKLLNENEKYEGFVTNLPPPCPFDYIETNPAQVYNENNLISLNQEQLPHKNQWATNSETNLPPPCPFGDLLETKVDNENNLISLNQEQYDSQRNCGFNADLPPPCPFDDIVMETGARLGGLMNDSIPSRNNTSLPITIEFLDPDRNNSRNMPAEYLPNILSPQQQIYEENNLISLTEEQQLINESKRDEILLASLPSPYPVSNIESDIVARLERSFNDTFSPQINVELPITTEFLDSSKNACRNSPDGNLMRTSPPLEQFSQEPKLPSGKYIRDEYDLPVVWSPPKCVEYENDNGGQSPKMLIGEAPAAAMQTPKRKISPQRQKACRQNLLKRLENVKQTATIHAEECYDEHDYDYQPEIFTSDQYFRLPDSPVKVLTREEQAFQNIDEEERLLTHEYYPPMFPYAEELFENLDERNFLAEMHDAERIDDEDNPDFDYSYNEYEPPVYTPEKSHVSRSLTSPTQHERSYSAPPCEPSLICSDNQIPTGTTEKILYSAPTSPSRSPKPVCSPKEVIPSTSSEFAFNNDELWWDNMNMPVTTECVMTQEELAAATPYDLDALQEKYKEDPFADFDINENDLLFDAEPPYCMEDSILNSVSPPRPESIEVSVQRQTPEEVTQPCPPKPQSPVQQMPKPRAVIRKPTVESEDKQSAQPNKQSMARLNGPGPKKQKSVVNVARAPIRARSTSRPPQNIRKPQPSVQQKPKVQPKGSNKPKTFAKIDKYERPSKPKNKFVPQKMQNQVRRGVPGSPVSDVLMKSGSAPICQPSPAEIKPPVTTTQQPGLRKQPPAPTRQPTNTNIQPPTLRMQPPAPTCQPSTSGMPQSISKMQQTASRLQKPASVIQPPAPIRQPSRPEMKPPAPMPPHISRIQQPPSRLQKPVSGIQPPAPTRQPTNPEMQPTSGMPRPASRMHPLPSKLQKPALANQLPAQTRQPTNPEMQPPTSRAQSPAPICQLPTSGMPPPVSRMQKPAYKLQRPGSGIQPPAPVCQPSAAEIQPPVTTQPPAPIRQPTNPEMLLPTSRKQLPAPVCQPSTSGMPRPASRMHPPPSRLQKPALAKQPPAQTRQPTNPEIQPPTSRAQSPAPVSRIQPPSPVCQSQSSETQPQVSRMQRPASRLQQPASGVPPPAPIRQQSRPEMQPPTSRMQPPASICQSAISGMQPPVSRLQLPASRLQLPGSRLQQPCSRIVASKS